MHCDGQLNQLSTSAYRTNRELTLWTPLVSCAKDNVQRLLLLHRGEDLKGIFQRSDHIVTRDVSYLPIRLRPDAIREEKKFSHLIPVIQEQFQRLYSAKSFYSPHVPLGSCILFDSDIWHGTYLEKNMSEARYSLDFRAVGEYRIDDASKAHTGRIYRLKGAQHFVDEECPPSNHQPSKKVLDKTIEKSSSYSKKSADKATSEKK